MPANTVHSAAAVASHNRPDDCWVIVRGVVYDVTNFLLQHPGGAGAILPWAGCDATVPFEETGHARQQGNGPLADKLTSLRIGILAGGPADASAAAPAQDQCDVPQLPVPSPATPSLIKPGGTGGWQVMDCPICGPICGAMHQPGDPAVLLAMAQKQGDAAARMNRWSEALDHYHEGIRAIRKNTSSEAIAAVRVGASIAQRKLGSLRSALRHADLGVASCAGVGGGGEASASTADPAAAAAHASRAAALEALGLVVDAHAAFVEAARLEPSQATHAEGAARLLPLAHLFLAVQPGSADAAGEPTASVPLPPLTLRQEELVGGLRRVVTTRQLVGQLLPLPTPDRVLSDDAFESSAWRTRQKRLLALLGVDIAADAARAAHGGHNGCHGVREWLVTKASELGLDVVDELVQAALAAEDDECDGSSSSAGGDDDDDDDEGPVGSEEVSLDSSSYGRCLVQIELAPLSQRLTLSLVSLNSADLGESALKYIFAVGLTSAYLLEATSLQAPLFEFAEWRTAERGAISPVEGLPPLASVERRARAYIDFFRSGEGAQPPVAPRSSPPASSFDPVEATNSPAARAVECT